MNLGAQAMAAEGQMQAFDLKYVFTEAVTDGIHTFSISARTSGAKGIVGVTTEMATVEVLGGPLRLVGTPITFPSPFSISKQGRVTIQYELSANAAVQIILVDISGQRIRNFVCESGAEGGSAGINKITWDGATDRGLKAGNGIYLGTILSRDDSRRLGSVKLSIVD